MYFLIILWLSQHPGLVLTEQGSQQISLDALLLTHDADQFLLPYERSLLQRVAQRHMTVGHMLAYLREQEQA